MKRPSFLPVKVLGRQNSPWKAEVPASISGTGKKERRFFATKAAAVDWLSARKLELANYGIQGLTGGILSPAEVEQAAAALALLKPHGVSLNEVVRLYLAQKQASEASVTFDEAFAAFKIAGRRSDSYTRSLRQTQNRMTTLHGHKLNAITPAMLDEALAEMKPSVRNFTLRILGGLFMLGIKRGWCSENPVKRVDMAQREAVEIALYTTGEVATIMAATAKHDDELVPFMALSFFAGLRLAEVQRLEWKSVDLLENFVKLPASITKTKRTRHIDLSANVIQWLTPYAGREGKVVSCSSAVLINRLAALREIHKVKNIKHGARHAFASYWLAANGDVDRLCLMLGHESPTMTFKHYAKAATKRDAGKFWGIVPTNNLGGRVPQKKPIFPTSFAAKDLGV